MIKKRSHYEENLILHAENARLRKIIEAFEQDPAYASHLAKMQASFDAEIRKLSNSLARETKEKERFHKLWQDCVRRSRYTYDIDQAICIDDLKEKIRQLEELNTTLSTRLQEAEELIAKLKAQMNRDHENSSIPSSQKPFHKKICNSRVRTGRKPGAQNGHVPHPRPHLEPTSPVIEIPATQEMLSDPDIYPTDEFISKQYADIHVSVSVTEYRTRVYRNRKTGARVHAPFPDGIVNEFNYGQNVKALAFLLNNYCNVSIDKTSELIEGISAGRISLSKGMISSLPSHFSRSTKEQRDKIFSMLLLAPSMHSDFTPARVNGKSTQVIFCGNDNEVLYSFREQKGHEGIKGTPAEVYEQTLIHDHDTTYYSYGGSHQECLSHILRYLKDAMENEPDLSWHMEMRNFLQGMIHELKQDRNISEEQASQYEKRYLEILNKADAEYLEHPPNKYYPEGRNLSRRMRSYMEDHLYFLRHPDVDYTNNLAERELRKIKRKLRQAVTFRCNQSVQYLCDSLSIIETARIQGANIFDTCMAAFS